MKRLLIITLFISGFFSVFASPNVIDVAIAENIYEKVTYNPLGPTGGLFVDTNENRTVYMINGTINITNNHPTEAIYNIVLNLTGISHIENVSYYSGRYGNVTTFDVANDYMLVEVPDLGPGQSSIITYDVQSGEVEPPLNFTSSYSDSRIFAGLPITVNDSVVNMLNTSYPNTCIYDINITQKALGVNVSGTIYNFTFDAASLSGLDAGNASISGDNLTLDWSLWNLGCFYRTNTTNIFYDYNTPAQVNIASTYKMMNTTISYSLNTTASMLSLASTTALVDMDVQFDKYINNTLTGDNATWRVNGSVMNPTNITANLTTVSFWVSVRDATGTGFTNPSAIDNDTISNTPLTYTLTPNQLMNNTLADWNSTGAEWFFNYTYSTSPIVWMDIDNFIVNDGVQLTNRSITYGQNGIYIKEIYVATGYWLQISRNITRLADNNYSVFIRVYNLGTSPTPANQVVQVYNFIPNTFTLTSNFSFSASPWYNTTNASEVLNDPIYNGTMHQFAIMPDGNPANSSLDMWGGIANVNNTWTVEYNVTGTGQFNFDDLFLTGVDPLHVEQYGATSAVNVESILGFAKGTTEVVMAGVAAAIGLLLLIL